MSVHSSVALQEFALARDSALAWMDSRVYLRALFSDGLGIVRIEQRAPALITDVVGEAYLNSIVLLVIALTASTVFGVLIGTFLAVTRHRVLILPILTLTLLGISVPSFFAGILLQRGEILYFQTFGKQLVKLVGFAWDFQHMFLPLLVLAARPLAYLTRASYLSLDQVLEQEFIRTAHAKGLTHRRTVNIHALRNIIVPVLTAIGVSFRFSLGSLPVVELFFLWPGLGYNILQAIDARQTALVTTLALVLGLTILLFNLALDIIYRLVDPRLRELS